MRERRLRLLESLFVLVGIVSAAAAIKPPSGFETAYAYLFSLFVFSALGTYASILFEIPLNTARRISYYVLSGTMSFTFAGLLMLVFSVGLTGTGLLGVPVAFAFYGASSFVLLVLLARNRGRWV